MTTPSDLHAQIAAEAKSIRAINDGGHEWEDCPQQEPGFTAHRRGHLCEHQVAEWANHLVRNRVQREDAQKQLLLAILRDMLIAGADGSGDYVASMEAAKVRARAAFAGLEPNQTPSTRLYRNEAGVLEEYRVEKA